ISREDQDEWALRSHRKAAAGWDDGRLAAEVAPVYVDGHAVTADNHIRRDSTLEKLATLRPVFDREHGTITAGNASPLTDGAAAVVLASEARADALGLEPLAAVRSYAYAAVDPADQLLIAPAYAIPIALKRAGLTLSDISLIEMHEAFAAQVLSTFHVLEQNGAGRVDEDVVNVMGGSIALGHPFGATGARLVTTLANEMRRRGVQFGLGRAVADAREARPRGLVIVSAKPDQFVAGADLTMLANRPSAAQLSQGSREIQRIFSDLAALRFATVAAINGSALGGGYELALACDWRIAADAPSVRVGLPEVSLGLLPGAGGTQRLPRLVGLPRALDQILNARRSNARRALRAGLVDEVVHPAALERAAHALA